MLPPHFGARLVVSPDHPRPILELGQFVDAVLIPCDPPLQLRQGPLPALLPASGPAFGFRQRFHGLCGEYSSHLPPTQFPYLLVTSWCYEEYPNAQPLAREAGQATRNALQKKGIRRISITPQDLAPRRLSDEVAPCLRKRAKVTEKVIEPHARPARGPSSIRSTPTRWWRPRRPPGPALRPTCRHPAGRCRHDHGTVSMRAATRGTPSASRFS